MPQRRPRPHRRAHRGVRPLHGLLALVLATAVVAACGSDDEQRTVTVIAHDSFVIDDELVAAFEEETGLDLVVQRGGDAVEIVNQAILSRENPQGDVLVGVDDATLARALDEDLFEVYTPGRLADVPAELIVDPDGRATPFDHGAVCVNYDAEWFAAEGLEPPTSLADLADPAYADLLVVQDATSSSPGTAFVTATIAEFGVDGWLDYWADLRANGVLVAADWTDAYYTRFSGGSGEGDRPLVVSYGSSPPAEVLGIEPLPETAPTGVVESTCVRQVELAGVLANAENPEGAQQFIDLLLSDDFQASVAMNMFVYPVVGDVALPEEFERFAVVPDAPYQLDADLIASNRDEWLADWTDTVLR